MPFSRVAEQRIREALAQGGFDNLPNAGQRIDLDDYFSAPEELRAAYAILKNANCVPAEVDLLNDAARLKEQIAAAVDPVEQRRLERRLIDIQTRLAMALERRRRGER